MEMETGVPRILILSDGDPDGGVLFSGAAQQLALALERLGCVHAKADVSAPASGLAGSGIAARALRKLDNGRHAARARWARNRFDANTRRAHAAAQAHPGYQACLQFGTTYRPPSGVSSYCYLDATVRQVWRAKAWEFRHFSDRFAWTIDDYQRKILRECACVFTFSQWAARSVIEDYGVAADHAAAVGAGPVLMHEALPHGPYDQRRILFVGKDFERKGGPLIVEAFKLVHAQLSDATLAIVGCTPSVDAPGVEVIGPIDKRERAGLERLLRLYSEASILCLMSDFEPFGLVVLEAGACGVPSATPNRFAFPETVLDGVTGRHVAAYDSAALADALIAMLRDPAQLKTMGEAARRHVHAQYTWDNVAGAVCARIARDTVQHAPVLSE